MWAKWCLCFLINCPSLSLLSFQEANVTATVTIHSDFGAPQNKICHRCNFFPFYFPWSHGTRCLILSFLNAEFQASFFTLLFHPHQGALCPSLLSAIRVVASTYLRLLIFLPSILSPACDSPSPAFRMMYSAYKLNKQGNNIQLCCTIFSVFNQSVVHVYF